MGHTVRREMMPDGSARSGLSQNVVSEIVRERQQAIVERDRYREALKLIADGNQHAPSIAKAALNA